MPLHLLSKKSWNVYNSDNVERVRRDEADAQAREEAEEQRMQEADAVRRIALLRGESPPSFDPPVTDAGTEGSRAECTRSLELASSSHPRKWRRLRGEDDTDRDIRYVREDAEAGEKARTALSKGGEGQEAPLVDHAGHVQLIPAPDEKAIRKAEKNAEAEAEKAKKRKREEDQYTMRFSNAAGFNNGMARPWYAISDARDSKASPDSASTALVLPHVQAKDAWGNEDPLRKERERSRISSNDPFAAMQSAQRQLKQSERDKEKWQKARQAELEDLQRAEERKRRHDRKHLRRDDDQESLEGFNLDAEDSGNREQRDKHKRHHRHHRHHRHRSRSRERSRDRHRDRRSRYRSDGY